jgi:hypothetical protein
MKLPRADSISMTSGVRRHRSFGVILAWISVQLSILVCGNMSHAETQRRVGVDYVAPRGCSDADAFAADLHERVPQVALTRDADALHLDVRLRRHGDRFEGRVTVREADGSVSQRTVTGVTCEEVVSAVTLIAALAIDPSPPPRPTPEEPAAPAATDPDGAPRALAAAPPEGERPAGTRDVQTATASRPLDRVEAAPARGGSTSLSVGAHAGASSRINGTVLASGALFFDLQGTTRAVFDPALRVRFERTSNGTAAAPRGAGQFTWTLGSVELCPLAWSMWRVRISPCARVDGGALAAEGRDVQPSRSDVRVWLSAGAVGRARFLIAGPLYAELEEALFAPLVRDRFYVAPDVTVFRAAALGWAMSGGLGVSIW